MHVKDGCIYLLTNLVNGKRYVGQHKNSSTVKRRWDAHIYCALVARSRYAVHRALRKHGVEKFSAEVIWTGPYSELDTMEKTFIAEFNTYTGARGHQGYNTTKGGGGPEGFRVPARARRKASARLKAQWASPAYARRRTDEVRAMWQDPEFRERHSAAMKLAVTPELRAKQRKNSKAMWRDAEFRERHRSAMASAMTPEVRTKMSTSIKASCALRSAEMAQAARDVWKSKEHRAKHAASMALANAKPELRAKHAANSKAMWADPEFRARHAEAMQKAYAKKKAQQCV